MPHSTRDCDIQFQRELLRRIAAYHPRGIQVSDVVVPLIQDMRAHGVPQPAPTLFVADPAHDIRERSLAALRLFTQKGWIALTYVGHDDVTEGGAAGAILTPANQGRFMATMTALGRTQLETGSLAGAQPPRAAWPQPHNAVHPRSAYTHKMVSIAAMVHRKVRRYPQPTSDVAARRYIATSIAGRRGQQAFRQQLLHLYQRCLVTGCNAGEALEAAHIQAYSAAGTFEVSNGLLLRADIHTLFDLGFLAIDTSTMTVLIADVLRSTDYSALHGHPLQFPQGTAHIPNRPALDQHRSAHASHYGATLLAS